MTREWTIIEDYSQKGKDDGRSEVGNANGSLGLLVAACPYSSGKAKDAARSGGLNY